MTDTDKTEAIRKEMIPQMPAELAGIVEAGGDVWTTEEMQRDFEPLGFMAPLMVCRRRSDGLRGSLKFTHWPRFYFDFQPE